jgi:phosphatidate cytidylyltransferase
MTDRETVRVPRVAGARAARAAARDAAGGDTEGRLEPVEPATRSRAGRDLPAAIGVGLALAAVVIGTLLIYRPSFAVVVGLAVAYGTYELCRAIAKVEARPSLVPLVAGGAAILAAAWFRGPNGLVMALLVTVCAVAVWRLADGADGYLRDFSASVFVAAYVPMLAGFAVLLAHPHDGAGRVIVFVATVVCSDTGGYATGVLFGRHPLAPMVSKGKTWEGFAGSVVACCVAGALFMTLVFHHEWWKGVLFGLAIVVTATLGDLGESMLKRDLGLKDMGSLLPGHGGLMDRLDSLLPCAAVAYLILSAFAPV